MERSTSVIIPFSDASAGAAVALAAELAGKAQVILAGTGSEPPGLTGPELSVLAGRPGKGAAIREALSQVRAPVTVIHDADVSCPPETHDALIAPLREDTADAVYGNRFAGRPDEQTLVGRSLSRMGERVTGQRLSDPLTGLRAVRTDTLRSITLTSDADEVDAELLVKLAAQRFRFAEVPVTPERLPRRSMLGAARQLATLLRYSAFRNDADNLHEGYNTLAHMDGATNYNAWLGRRFRQHLGARVLEIGAGIGTITREIEKGRELVVALEVDGFYVDRLKNVFRDRPHVQPYLSDVALADWEALRERHFDSILLSNVLEHIPDDAAALRRFRQVLPEGGTLVLLVPALPSLFGAMDEAVGHHRRYTREGLKTLLEENGFSVERLEWMNLLGIPGWYVNGRIFRRRAVPKLQLKVYDTVAPLLAAAESKVRLPVGMSLFAVARVRGSEASTEA